MVKMRNRMARNDDTSGVRLARARRHRDKKKGKTKMVRMRNRMARNERSDDTTRVRVARVRDIDREE